MHTCRTSEWFQLTDQDMDVQNLSTLWTMLQLPLITKQQPNVSNDGKSKVSGSKNHQHCFKRLLRKPIQSYEILVFDSYECGAWWLIGTFVAFCPKGHKVRRFESCSGRHVGTLGKSFTSSCPWLFGVKLRHSIRVVSGAPLSSGGIEEVLQK